jgi:mRNA-degrading endonuclease RelE of RelBE toxin-antitoxin system
MKYQVLWRHFATEQLLELALLNPKQARRIGVVVRGMQIGQFGDIKKLSGAEEWRVRVGEWRVIRLLDGDVVYINEVNNRRDAY